jgi:CheY-like chemotaxis protein
MSCTLSFPGARTPATDPAKDTDTPPRHNLNPKVSGTLFHEDHHGRCQRRHCVTTKAKTVLVVDDTKNLREIIAFTLRARGWGVLESDNGDDALEKARSQQPDLILLDVMLPGKTGFEVCSMLKGDDRYKHIPIVMLSAITKDSGKSDDHWKELSSADAFISKPFHAFQLVQCIESLLGRPSVPAEKPSS